MLPTLSPHRFLSAYIGGPYPIGYVDATVLLRILYTFHYYLEARGLGIICLTCRNHVMIDIPEGPYGPLDPNSNSAPKFA